jgi:hypothetical protein
MKKREAFPDDYRFPYNELKTPEARQVADQIREIRDKCVPRKEWENLTEYFFDILADYLGQYDARCIFNKFAKPVTKREAQLQKSAGLLFRYIYMKPKRGDVAKLVRQLAREDGIDKDAITQSLWRALNTKTPYGKKVRAYLREELHERGITVRTQDNNGRWIDVWATDFLHGFGKSPDDALSDLETSLRDTFGENVT